MKEGFKQKKSNYLLELALEEQLYSDEDINNFKAEEEWESPHIFSNEHQKRMEHLHNMAERAENSAKRKRNIGKSAAAVSMVLGLSILTVTNVEAFRISVITFLSEIEQKYITFLQNDNHSISVTRNFQKNEPLIILDGFNVSRVKEYSDHVIISYLNNDGAWYNYYYYEEAQPLSVDTKSTTAEEIIINGSKTVMVKKEGLLQLIMFKGHSQYMISGTISPDDAYKLITSVN